MSRKNREMVADFKSWLPIANCGCRYFPLRFRVHMIVKILMDIKWSDMVNLFEHIVQSLFNTCFLAFIFTSTLKPHAIQRANYNYLIGKSDQKYSPTFREV